MSFSIDRYKEVSRRLDTTGIDWDRVRDHALSQGDLYFLHYSMDIENSVPLYLSHLLVTRACMNPVLTSFLSCWVYEELWHGENIAKFLNLYGVDFDAETRIANIRAGLGLYNTMSIFTTMVGSWLLEDFAAIYLTVGAINELSTATAYGALARKAGHPVLEDLLGRIQKDERRHFAFYYNSAQDWLSRSRRTQRLARLVVEKTFVIVGRGIKTEEEVDATALYLFDDAQGQRDVEAIDEKIGKLPGFSGVRLMARELERTRHRVATRPGWAKRLIENESWARLSARDAVRLPTGALVGAGLRLQPTPADNANERTG
jgi:fatty acid desaturase